MRHRLPRHRELLALGFSAIAATLVLPSIHAFVPHVAAPAALSVAAEAPSGGPAVASAAAAHDPASCPLCLAAGKLRSFLSARAARLEACPETPPRCLARGAGLGPALSPTRGASAPRAPPA